jgi:GT2 family glycosyltransferase
MSIELSLFIHRPVTPGPLTIVSRGAFDSVHGYDETHAFGEDYDFGLRLDKAGHRVHILRETVAVWSLRRMRKEGKISVVQKYAASAAVALITRHPLKSMPGYIMGGHLYNKKKKPIGIQALRSFNKQLQKIIKEVFK